MREKANTRSFSNLIFLCTRDLQSNIPYASLIFVLDCLTLDFTQPYLFLKAMTPYSTTITIRATSKMALVTVIAIRNPRVVFSAVLSLHVPEPGDRECV